MAAGTPLPRHGDGAAPYLERDAYAEHHTSGHLGHNLSRQRGGGQRRRKIHIEVEKPPEHGADDELEELHALETAAQYQYLHTDKDYIHDIGVVADGQRWGHTLASGKHHHHGDGRDDAAAETRPYGQRHPEGHHEQ